jgi:hypothetical protein
MDWKDVFYTQHATVHGPAVGREGRVSYEALVLDGLDDAQLRLRPADNLNSLAWVVWHMTRCEDVAINLAVSGRPQVLDDGWVDKLGTPRVDIGTGMTPAEVGELSESIDLDALMSYRHAVGQRTREVIGDISDAVIEQPVDGSRYQGAAILGEHAGWVADFWAPWRGTDFLFLATGHCYHHWGEGITIRSVGGFGLSA